jgi:hypothetical protein
VRRNAVHRLETPGELKRICESDAPGGFLDESAGRSGPARAGERNTGCRKPAGTTIRRKNRILDSVFLSKSGKPAAGSYASTRTRITSEISGCTILTRSGMPAGFGCKKSNKHSRKTS